MEALPEGKVMLAVDFQCDAGGMGEGAQVTLSAAGKKIAEDRLVRTIPIQFFLSEGFDIGTDVGSPIDFTDKLPVTSTYKLPVTFSGKKPAVRVQACAPACAEGGCIDYGVCWMVLLARQ